MSTNSSNRFFFFFSWSSFVIYDDNLIEFNFQKKKAIKKFGIAGDWRKYTLFLHFREKERSLRYNEYPLLLKRQLCDDEEPTFSIRHIRQFDDLESIHSSRESISLKRNNSNKNHQPQGGSTTNLYAQDNSSLDSIEKLMGLEETPQVALGIYEYVAVLDDEVSISIGESVKVLRRATGWWYVENPLGFFGWTPSGCLDLVEKVCFFFFFFSNLKKKIIKIKININNY